MKGFIFFMVFAAACLAEVGCAPSAGSDATPRATQATASVTVTDVETATPNATEPVPNETMTNTATLSTAASASELVVALELAAQEMRGGENIGSLAGARMHAEATVNILVGKFGRWYGDQDGDGNKTDPSKGRGVLPGEIVTQGADLDNGVKFPAGLALLAAGTQRNPPELARLLGDTDMWRAKPRAGYDAIEAAVQSGDKAPQLEALVGAVPRAVALARLLLTKAKTVEDAHALATRAIAELEAAGKEARALAAR